MDKKSPIPASRHAVWYLLAGFFLVWSLRATVLFPLDAEMAARGGGWAYAAAWKIGVWAVPAVVYTVLLFREPLGRVLRLSTPVKRAGGATVAAVAGGGIAAANAVWIGGGSPDGLLAAPAAYLAVAGAAGVSVLCEELLFRGLILREFAWRTGFWRANAAQAVLFAAAHWPNWLWVRGVGVFVVSETLWVFALGLFFGWLVRLTGSLWPAVAAHLLVNVLLGMLYA